MRILAIGDIHGCSIALDSLLAAVVPQPEDKIITLGDYVDRGPDTKGVIDRLIALHATGQLIPLRGNHEQIMLNSRADGKLLAWLSWGGKATLASYAVSGNEGTLQDIPESHWDFLENKCVNWYETDKHFFVHADAEPNLPLGEQPEFVLFWGPSDRPSPHFSGKTMVYGHDTQESGIPLNLGYAICIDTWPDGNGWLTCLDVTSGKVWQANQAGQQRQLLIDR
ncbi:serine/threonine protein phosphatase [Planktothrix sp. FACHB-1355]|uniref:Serine/threonine protein phosphatase n=1 Tax=Aerosakkonema funiforme FACHB-1375 TaxID=2949571 RepID=A0A926VFI3_9CYAN|nr:MULTISPECIES: metallophosphoesterase family protein [Oscillatoriales]MBD2182806.1 serine/threonine protein phosphatase [Aerosakkonema funiforme FACHB-1375]MBD3558026.1 serine/threonine protein phosphatase [Planktothrix sp. FACHB-1355]